MITKTVVKDYVAKRCKYLTKSELEDKSLIELIKNSLASIKDFNDVLAMDAEEGEEESEPADTVLDLTQVSKDYPHLRKDIKKYLEAVPRNNVEKLVEKYNDDQLVSKLSRKFIENLYGPENCVRCDLNGAGEEIVNQDLLTTLTRDALKNDKYKVLFEGQIEYENLRARFDVLIKNGDGTYTLYEVKGTNNVTSRGGKEKDYDSKVKDKYLYDLLFQYYIYTKAGMNFSSIGFITTNGNYTMNVCDYPTKEKIELCKLFTYKLDFEFKDGSRVTLLDYVKNKMYVKEDGKGQPDIDLVVEAINKIANDEPTSPSKMYECKKGPQCPFLNICFKDALDLNSIFKLTKWGNFGGSWNSSKALMENGIEKISDIDEAFIDAKYPVTKEAKAGYTKRNCARCQIDLEKGVYKTKYILDFKQIRRVLTRDYLNDEIKYLVFFDFESFQHPIPLVKDSHPWKQVVSQYSMHVVEKGYDLTKHDFDNGVGGGITHFEYIGNPDIDGYENPSFKLYETLKKQMESTGIDIYSNEYRVVVFNQNFEKTRMSEFTRDFGDRIDPDLRRFIDIFNINVVDLLFFFTDGGIYSRDFGGRGSLKVVQPGLTTDKDVLSYYKNLGLPFDFEYSLDYHKGDKCQVYNGAICLDLFKSLIIREHLGEKDKGIPTDELLKEALAYCKIDSWGTVIIYDIIKKVYEGKIKLDATIVG